MAASIITALLALFALFITIILVRTALFKPYSTPAPLTGQVNVFPGVSSECALIGIAEKGFVNLEMSLKSQGGHASAPPSRTIVGS